MNVNYFSELTRLVVRTTAILLACCLVPTIGVAQVLFEDNFDSGFPDPAWVEKNPGQWVQNGWFHTRNLGGPRDSMATAHESEPAWTDYVYSITVDPLEGQTWTRAHVFFKTEGFALGAGLSEGRGYQLVVTNHGIHSGPADLVFLVHVDCVSQPCSTPYLATVDYALPTEPFDMEITTTSDGHIVVKADEVTVIDVVDPDPFPYGGIGIGSIWEAEARFDNVSVTAISADTDGDGCGRR